MRKALKGLRRELRQPSGPATRLQGAYPPGLTEDDLEIVHVLRLRKYLRRVGWTRSAIGGRAVDADGNAYPWLTYPAVRFLEGRIRAEFRVFEYGSGSSTLWWSQRVASVVSCDHHRPWYDLMKQKMPPNVVYVHRALEPDGDYCREINNHAPGFDLVVIDGRDRVNCARQSAGRLSDAGVIVWDNAERERYRDGLDFLAGRGFRRIDFEGLGPVNPKAWTTSIFYRATNCLGI
jgi:hypothetical protein